jgi:hypothetical protein
MCKVLLFEPCVNQFCLQFDISALCQHHVAHDKYIDWWTLDEQLEHVCGLVNSCQQHVSKMISVGVAALGEFCFVSYHLILDSNPFTCYMKGLVRREAYGMLFFRILRILLCGDCTLGVAELREFCFVSYHLILDSNLFVCCLNGLVRWEAMACHSLAFWAFYYVVTAPLVLQNFVSSASFVIILYLILIYLHVFWVA